MLVGSFGAPLEAGDMGIESQWLVPHALCSSSSILSGSWPCACRRLSPGRNWGLCWKGTLGSGWKAGLDVGLC